MANDLKAYIHRTADYSRAALLSSVDDAPRLQTRLANGHVIEAQAAALFDHDAPGAFERLREGLAEARQSLAVAGHEVHALALAWQMERDAEEHRKAPSGGEGDMHEGRVRVRLPLARGSRPYAVFDLSEADLASRADPTDRANRAGTVAYQAPSTAWSLTQFASGDEAIGDGAFPAEYAPQIVAYRVSGQPGVGVRERAEVTRHSRVRGLWRREPAGWELVDRRSAALTAAAAPRRAERTRQATNGRPPESTPAAGSRPGRQFERQR